MPNIKSAKKRVLVAAKKNTQNRAALSEVKSAIKKFNNAIDTNNIEEADKLLPVVFSQLDSAALNGLIHKNNAANKKSALAKKLSDVKSGKLVIAIKKDNKTIAAEKAKKAQETREAAQAEFRRQADEKKAAKLEAQQAKLKEAEKKPAKAKKAKDEEKAPATAEVKEEKKAPAKKATKKAEVKEEKAEDAKAE